MFSSNKKYFVLLAEDAVLDVENVLHITDQEPNCPERAELIGCRWAQVDRAFYNRVMGETSLRDSLANFAQAQKGSIKKFSAMIGIAAVNPLAGIGLYVADVAINAALAYKTRQEIEKCWEEAHYLDELVTEGLLSKQVAENFFGKLDQ